MKGSMPNRDTDAAWKYHNGTKHSYLSVRTNPHALDWENKPLLFKIYPTLEVLRFPKDFTRTGVSALSAIAKEPSRAEAASSATDPVPDRDTLAQLLFFSAGVTKSRKYPGGETFFRAAACTGALYEIELYFACCDLPGLAAGVYHFGVAEFGLRQLRKGDFRRVLVEATGEDPSVASAPLIVICTGTYWRNAWKYRSRTYRHFGWDNGTILANLLSISAALKLPAQVITGFVDSQVNTLLDLDTNREVAFSLVAVGRGPKPPGKSPILDRLELPVVAYSRSEVDFPAMRQMHQASSLQLPDEVTTWRAAKSSFTATRATSALAHETKSFALDPLRESEVPSDSLEQVIQRRGSTRQFSRDPISFRQLSTILDRATRRIPMDVLSQNVQFNDLYLIVNNVHDLPAGSYFYDQTDRQLHLLKEGEFRDRASYLGLEQQLPGDASVDVFFLADLSRILERFGNRGYRAAQLEAGIVGGRMYLAAYAQHLGASGLTFYDDDVVNFFSPHAKGKSAIFLVALGKSVRSSPVR
jgi:SagB-type dehydrogenase family enzyme